MEPQLLSAIGDRLPMISTIALLFLAAIAFPRLFAKNPLSQIPLWGEELGLHKRREMFKTGSKSVYQNGYNKFKRAVGFRVTSLEDSGEKLVISPAYLEELRKLPDSVLSFEGFLDEMMEKKYTRVPAPNSIHVTPHVVKADLTPALTRINPILSAEVDSTVVSEIGDCDDWTPVNINRKLLRIVAIVSGRIFIGPELCHDELYIESAIKYTVELMEAQREIKDLSPWVKAWKAPKLASVIQLRKRENDFFDFIRPTLEARSQSIAAGEKQPEDMLAWLMAKGEKLGVTDVDNLSQIQLGLSFAAIHTTTLTTTNVFYNLVAHPETIAPLREEIREVLDEFNGVLTFPALQRLRKLDSFIKESLRVDPAGFVSMTRKVMQPFTLSSGQYIPAGTMIEVPAHAISRDPDIYPEPETFKPWRFYDLKNEGLLDNGKAQFVSINPELMTFGYGRHACPGRFFAANEIKMILARTLLNYDMKMVGGETKRYPNFEIGQASVPDPTKDLLFKAVST